MTENTSDINIEITPGVDPRDIKSINIKYNDNDLELSDTSHTYKAIKKAVSNSIDAGNMIVETLVNNMRDYNGKGKFPVYKESDNNKIFAQIYDILSEHSDELVDHFKNIGVIGAGGKIKDASDVVSLLNATFSDCLAKSSTNIIDYSDIAGVVKDLFNYSISQTPAMGSGELAMCILFDDIVKIKASKKDGLSGGDVFIQKRGSQSVDGSIEVKGLTGRVTTQGGVFNTTPYSDDVAKQVYNLIIKNDIKIKDEDGVVDFGKKFNYKKFSSIWAGLIPHTPKNRDLLWNCGNKAEKNATYLEYVLAKIVFSILHDDRQEMVSDAVDLISNIVTNTISSILGHAISSKTNAAPKSDNKFNASGLSSASTIEDITTAIVSYVAVLKKEYIVKHFDVYWKHLQEAQNCKYFCIFGKDTPRILVIRSTEEFESLVNSGAIKIENTPRINSSAGVQGMAFSFNFVSPVGEMNEALSEPVFSISFDDLILEGGAAVNGRRILQSEVGDIMSRVDAILGEIGLNKDTDYKPVGSAGKKKQQDTSGDIDVAVSASALSGVLKCGSSVNDIIKALSDSLIKMGYDKVVPQYGFKQISMGLPINGDDDIIQVDFMISSNIEWSDYMNFSPDYTKDESKYKGLVRNILLMNIVKYCFRTTTKQLTTKDGQVVDSEVETYVIRLTDGVYKTRKSYANAKNNGLVKTPKLLHEYDEFITNTPQELVDLLFNGVSMDETYTFESLYALLLTDKFKYPQYRDKIIVATVKSLDGNSADIPGEIDPKYIEDARSGGVDEMKYILSRNKFMLLEKMSADEIAKFDKPIDAERVVIVPGRFQPFHKGHLAMIKNAADKFGVPVCVLQVKSKSDKSPIPEDVLRSICKDVEENEDYIAAFSIFPIEDYGRAVASYLVKYTRRIGLEPVGIGCGEDRLRNWEMLTAWMKSPKTDTFVDPGFEVMSCDDRSAGFSGTKVREAIKNDDFEAFKEMMPEYLWKYYDELRLYIK